jgi:hypothetical protein
MEKATRSSANGRAIVREVYQKKHAYWNNTGKHQDLSDQLSLKVSDLYKGDGKPIKWHSSKNAHLTLLNGMSGCYTGFHNDGDTSFGAIDNNRVHGFSTVESFYRFCKDQGATQSAQYVLANEENKSLLERAMDEVILLARSIEKIK